MPTTKLFAWLCGFLLLTSTSVMAQYPVIDAEQVRSQMTGKKKGALIDTRTAEEYIQGHIPGAINIMPDDMKIKSASLPKDKTAPLIFYCRGVN